MHRSRISAPTPSCSRSSSTEPGFDRSRRSQVRRAFFVPLQPGVIPVSGPLLSGFVFPVCVSAARPGSSIPSVRRLNDPREPGGYWVPTFRFASAGMTPSVIVNRDAKSVSAAPGSLMPNSGAKTGPAPEGCAYPTDHLLVVTPVISTHTDRPSSSMHVLRQAQEHQIFNNRKP